MLIFYSYLFRYFFEGNHTHKELMNDIFVIKHDVPDYSIYFNLNISKIV
jgi:hypothetical protein